MSLNLHLLRLFATVVRTGSFSKAADVLLVSQPSVSKGVRDFEMQLGCRLLDRLPRGVTPTREGVALMRHADVLFAAERSAEEELRALRSLNSGSLRIGASSTIATYLIPDFLGAFHTAHPSIEVQLVSANTRNVADLMLRHEIEIALVEGPIDDGELESEAWLSDVMELIVGPLHPFASAFASAKLISLDDIASEVLILREPGSGSREVVTQALAAHNIVPARTLEIGSTEAIKQLVAAGLGVSIVSVSSVADQVALGRLRRIPVHGLHIERTLWKLKARGRIVTPAAVAFERLISPAKNLERYASDASVSPRLAPQQVS